MSRLTFRPPSQQVRAWITSFMLLLDLKVGCTVITFFALFNKIAGIFGIIAVFSGGTFAQITLYIYSIGTIGLLLWALRGISDENACKTLRFAHLFLADHLVSSFWTLHFAMHWYTLQPHDGSKPQLAPHQAGLMDLIEKIENSYEIPGSIKHHVPLAGQERVDAAQQVWKEERSFSAAVLAAGWVLKVYFALILYSYALHLRHGTYHSLWQSKSGTPGTGHLRMRSRGYQQVPAEAHDLLPRSQSTHARAAGDANGGGYAGAGQKASNARMTRTASSSSTRES
ncbi:Protein of unknown function DUF1753, Golgi [Ceraceosorus bombacis]|uniref:DUF1753-domain-containing protein n=1 Tax=Ceraceosorus bombacis TaxID=401625 RepID=A0A0P1BMB0_9BASI|nr:Protein of unknown function DUF1753, Golgi [Ceraceosorus bombacis]